jgi:hypothetical protein
MIPRITPFDTWNVRVEFPYTAEAVAQLKSEIPGAGRKWDKDAKCWVVVNDFADYAVDVLSANFKLVDVHPEVEERIKRMRNHEEGL